MNVGRMQEILRILENQGIKHQELAELTDELQFDIETMAIEKLDTFSRDFDDCYKDRNPDQFSLESLYERFDNDEIMDCLTENGTYNTVLAYVDQRSTKAAETFVKIGLSIDNGVYTVFDRQGNKYETDSSCLGNVFEQFLGFFTPLSMNGFCDTSAHFREYYIEKTWFEKLFGQPEKPVNYVVEVGVSGCGRKCYTILSDNTLILEENKTVVRKAPYKNFSTAQKKGKAFIC
jgi:hypothetical protein